MASAVPTLLAKIACLRPRIICFVGKGIWLHVERSLRPGKGNDAEACAVLATHAGKTGVMMKEEESGQMIERAPVSLNARAVKPEPEFVAFGVANSSNPGADGDVPLRQILIVQRAEERLPDATLSPSSPITTRCGSISSRYAAPRKAEAATGLTFAYGLQPYKAVHNVEPNVRSARNLMI
jgi:hypothetical protein